MWLAVHSLLMYQEIESKAVPELAEDAAEEMGRQECASLAVIAVMAASQEVKSGISDAD